MFKPFAIAFAIALLSASLAPASASPITALPKAQASYASGSLHVDEYGTAGKPNLILLPGLTCGPWEFGNEIAALGHDYHIYALTLPGFDGQPAIAKPLFETVNADFWTLLADRKIEKPVVVGHSLGGTMAAFLATHHPERLRAIVAIDGLPVFPGTETQSQAERQSGATRMAAMVANTPKAQYETVLKTYTMPYLVTAKTDVDADAALEARSEPAAAAEWIKEDLLLDLRPELTKASVPYLLIAPYDASFEKSFSTAEAKRAYYASLVSNAPTAKTVVIENSRHFIMNDRPQALDGAIKQFLATLPAAS